MRDRLVGGRTQGAAQGPGGIEAGHRRAGYSPAPRMLTVWPSSRTRAAARSACSSPGDPERDRAGGHVGSRVEGHVLDVDPGLAERKGQGRDRSRPVGDDDPQLAQRARLEVGLQQAAPILPGGGVPGGDGVTVAAADQRRRLAQAPRHGLDRVGDGLAVAGEDVGPDRRVGAGDAGGVAEAGADLGQALGVAAQLRRRLGRERVGDDVRQVADRRQQAVVGAGVDRLRAGAEAGDEALQAVVEQAAGAVCRGQVPASALEEVGAGVIDPRGLGPGQRVAADEALVARPAPRPARSWSSRRR